MLARICGMNFIPSHSKNMHPILPAPLSLPCLYAYRYFPNLHMCREGQMENTKPKTFEQRERDAPSRTLGFTCVPHSVLGPVHSGSQAGATTLTRS